MLCDNRKLISQSVHERSRRLCYHMNSYSFQFPIQQTNIKRIHVFERSKASEVSTPATPLPSTNQGPSVIYNLMRADIYLIQSSAMDKLGDDVSFSVILPTIVRLYLDSRDKYSRFRRCNNGLQRQKTLTITSKLAEMWSRIGRRQLWDTQYRVFENKFRKAT